LNSSEYKIDFSDPILSIGGKKRKYNEFNQINQQDEIISQDSHFKLSASLIKGNDGINFLSQPPLSFSSQKSFTTSSISSIKTISKIRTNQNFDEKFKRRGKNIRLLQLLSGEEIIEEQSSSLNTNIISGKISPRNEKEKTNKQMFEDIQKNIKNIKDSRNHSPINSGDSEDEREYIDETKSSFSNSNFSQITNTFSNFSNLTTNDFGLSQSDFNNNLFSHVNKHRNDSPNNNLFSQQNTQYKKRSSSRSKSPPINKLPDKNKFAFAQGNNKLNLNETITNELEKILEFHQNENNIFQSLAYRKAIAMLKNASEEITSCEQLKKYKYLGTSIGRKIKEIILTGKLKKSDYLQSDERNKSLQILTKVWGIGMGHANKLYKKGIKNIEDLRINQNLLTPNQIVGLKYYEDILKRIPRDECTEVLNIIKFELFKILPEEKTNIELCGSFRREKRTCGDIDILISRKDDGEINGILQSLIDSLMKIGLITEILSLVPYGTRHQFMGMCRLANMSICRESSNFSFSSVNRRIDIKIYKKKYYAFALLYFTGSAYFNRSMRLFASKLGYQLSDVSLRQNTTKHFIFCDTEEDIFNALGLDYKTPAERDI
jgi:DNA polymerase/3'-5' exonuclease PolX